MFIIPYWYHYVLSLRFPSASSILKRKFSISNINPTNTNQQRNVDKNLSADFNSVLFQFCDQHLHDILSKLESIPLRQYLTGQLMDVANIMIAATNKC